MNANAFRFGFRALGRDAERKLTDATAAFTAHVENDERAATDGECYLSAFQFGDEFRTHLETTGTTKGYSGPTWASLIGFDIDRADNLELALTDARRLAAGLEMKLGIDPECLMIFFSGSKGFHNLLPTWLMNPEPSNDFHTVTRGFCSALADEFGVQIDTGVYARVNLFRAPNSRHRKTGLFKRQLSVGELFGLNANGILKLASEPFEGEIPTQGDTSPAAVELWHQTAHEVAELKTVSTERRGGKTRLNPTTRRLLSGELPTEGDRHRLIFSAAGDMAEFESMNSLIQAILTEPGMNCGLTASDVSRQIETGIAHGGRQHGK